jgi:hypothetical protein
VVRSGANHPRIARSLSNLASNLRALGEHQRARDLDEQALAMYRRLYGDTEHPTSHQPQQPRH